MKFFTADWHIGHDKILELAKRPFNNIQEHDDYIRDKINEKCTTSDILYVLGDLSLRANYENLKKFITSLNPQVRVIKGNHDKTRDIKKLKQNNIIQHYSELEGTTIRSEQGRENYLFMCHYPLRSWNKSFHGSFHAYGHCHGTRLDYGNSTDVGVDCWEFEPVSEYALFNYLNNCKEI